jgi:hypothetical protein
VGVILNGTQFAAIHFVVSGGIAQPIFISGGALVGDGTIIATDLSGITEANVQATPPTTTTPGRIHGHVAGVATFIDLDGNVFGNGIVLDFDVPLFDDVG